MLLGLDYATPRAADDYEPRRACCKSWIAYRNKQRAKPPKDEEKPDFEKLPPLDANNKEARWRQWLAEPNALTNLKLEEGELWIAVGFLQLKGKDATARVPGRPNQSRVDHSRANATCEQCKTDAQSDEGKANLKKSREKSATTCLFPGCDGTNGRPMRNLRGYPFCGSKQKGCIKRALDYEAEHGTKPEGVSWAEFYRPPT